MAHLIGVLALDLASGREVGLKRHLHHHRLAYPRHLRQRLRLAAVFLERQISELAEDAVAEYLDRLQRDRKEQGLAAIPEPAPAREPLKALTPDEFNVRAGAFSRLTRPFNAYGLPALSVPCGQSKLGLPLAFQLVGRPFDEALLLRVGHAYQEAASWHYQRPALG